MWVGTPIELRCWSELGSALRAELARLRHTGLVLLRNFDLVTADIAKDFSHLGETDRLQIVLETGVDRDNRSEFWDVLNRDYQHELFPAGKRPNEIIYAYVVDASPDPYLVHIEQTPETMDLTCSLGEENGILVYDAAKLRRVAKNEHWFECDPRSALLAVFRLAVEG